MTESRPPSDGPVAGLRVLDLSTVFAAPYVGGLLRDLGAEVLRIEPPGKLDQTRGGSFGPYLDNAPGDDGWNWSGTFHSLNRGKRAIALDLKQEAGREILWALVGQADVLLENFTPRVMRGWGMSYAELSTVNPRLVMLSNTGYGSNGPWSSFKAQGTTLEATMGLNFYSGYAGMRPRKVGQSYPDFLAAWIGLTAILAALIERRTTGTGRWIDLGMYELGGVVLPEAFLAAQAGIPLEPRTGDRELGVLVSGVVLAKDPEDWLAVGIVDDAALAAAGAVVPGLPTRVAGPADETAALAVLARWAAERTAAEAAEELQARGIAASPVSDVRGLLQDPQYAARRFFEWIVVKDQERPVVGRPYRWHGRTDVRVRGRGPLFAEHNDEVLNELGLSTERVAELCEARVVVDRPSTPPPGPADLRAGLAGGVFRELDPNYREFLAATRRAPSEPTTEPEGA